MIYFLILFILYLLAFAIEDLPNNKSKKIFYFIIIMLVLFSGLRGDIEPDYSSYKDIFYWAGISEYSAEEDTEIGFFYLNRIIYTTGLNFQWVIFLMAFFTIILKAIFFKKVSKNFVFSILLYYCSVFFLFEFIAIRQALAMSIFFFGIPYILERNFLKYTFIVLLGSLFHLSIFLVFPLYFLVHKKWNVLILYGILGFSSFVSISQIEIPFVNNLIPLLNLSSYTTAKLEIYDNSDLVSVLSIKQMLFALIFIVFRTKFPKEVYYNILLNIFVVGVLFTTIFNEIPEFSYRIKFYFFWTDTILMVLIINFIAKNNFFVKVLLYTFVVVIYSFTLYTFLDDLSGKGHYIYPYKTFIDIF